MNKITEKEIAKLKMQNLLVTSITCRYDCDIGPTEPSEQIVSFWTETC